MLAFGDRSRMGVVGSRYKNTYILRTNDICIVYFSRGVLASSDRSRVGAGTKTYIFCSRDI